MLQEIILEGIRQGLAGEACTDVTIYVERDLTGSVVARDTVRKSLAEQVLRIVDTN